MVVSDGKKIVYYYYYCASLPLVWVMSCMIIVDHCVNHANNCD